MSGCRAMLEVRERDVSASMQRAIMHAVDDV